jgi:hypothetical protein
MDAYRPYHSERQTPVLAGAWLAMTGALAVALVFVWSAGQLAGALAHGSWPTVSLVDSVAELVQLCRHPNDPIAPGVPGGAVYFTILGLLVLVTSVLALRVLRLLLRRQAYWVPPRVLSQTSYQPFLRVYREERGRRWR